MVEDLKGRYRNGQNEMNEKMIIMTPHTTTAKKEKTIKWKGRSRRKD